MMCDPNGSSVNGMLTMVRGSLVSSVSGAWQRKKARTEGPGQALQIQNVAVTGNPATAAGSPSQAPHQA